jgi:ATP-dependent RNA helicase DHX8/PRP22
VEIFYSREPVVDYIEACVRTVLDIHTLQPKGDVLVFLPGQVEIDRVVEMVNDRVSGLARALQDVLCLPMYVMLLTYV